VDQSHRRIGFFLPVFAVFSLLVSGATILLMAVDLPLPLPALPVPATLLAGAAAGVAGLITVVSSALQRQSYVWTVFGIVGMAVGIATGLTVVQAG
jgi:hypothetical protein